MVDFPAEKLASSGNRIGKKQVDTLTSRPTGAAIKGADLGEAVGNVLLQLAHRLLVLADLSVKLRHGRLRGRDHLALRKQTKQKSARVTDTTIVRGLSTYLHHEGRVGKKLLTGGGLLDLRVDHSLGQELDALGLRGHVAVQ